MGRFMRRSASAGPRKARANARPACPLCGSGELSLGAIDHVARTVRHRCRACGYGWADGEIDLVSAELVARTQRETARAVRR